MITKITIENFRGICDSRTLSFLANAKRVKNKSGIINVNKKEILLVNSLLGKNASGKTSFIEGFNFLRGLARGDVYRVMSNYFQTLHKEKNRNKEIVNMNLKLENIMHNLLKKDFHDSSKSIKMHIEFIRFQFNK